MSKDLNKTTKDVKTGFPTEIIKEGRVEVLVPKLEAFVSQPADYAPSKAPVFYNPVMELNRDLSVIALQVFQRTIDREIQIAEPLTSSGIRGVRFAVEVNGVNKVSICDINRKALELAQENVKINGCQEQITVKHLDANCFLSCHGAPRKRFDVVDIDPFGSPVPYLDSSIRALRNNGLLAVTATDLAPLCGVHSKACVRKYGARPLRTEYCQELAVRILAGCIALTAAKQDIGISIVFSHCTDHYLRVYARNAYGARKADFSLKNMGYVLHCFNCLHREATKEIFGRQTMCKECGFQMEVSGPLWIGKILDRSFCDLMAEENRHRILKNSSKIKDLLSLAKEEVEAPITYFVLDKISKKLALSVPPVRSVLKKLRERGFEASRTHFNSRGIKTNAPALAVIEVLKETV